MALPADFWYRSFKELSKAVNSYIPTLSLPLPDDLIQVIQAYLDKHYPIEESDSQRLHDELLNIYQRCQKQSKQILTFHSDTATLETGLNRFCSHYAMVGNGNAAYAGSSNRRKRPCF
jgi:hypothetical protein